MYELNTMDRRLGARVPTDMPLRALQGGRVTACRALNLSAGGALVRHRRSHDPALVQHLEIALGADRRLTTLARTVWSCGSFHAVRFIGLSDVDRLDIAEHLDVITWTGRLVRAERRSLTPS